MNQIHVKWLEQNEMKMIKLQALAPSLVEAREKATQILSATAETYNLMPGHTEFQGNKVRLITPNIRIQVTCVVTTKGIRSAEMRNDRTIDHSPLGPKI